MTNPTAPDIRAIPLIVPVFNQLTYLKNIITWWRWYYPENKIFILDNGSDYKPLLDFYDTFNYPSAGSKENILVVPFMENNCANNLRLFLDIHNGKFDYYVISDPDIMPHPSTPPNFLEIFKANIDLHNYHRVGFGLITEDIPDWIHDKAMIQGNEKELLGEPVFHSHGFPCYKAPIDTTFCLYKASNGGWSAPMDGANWGNCLRMFKAFHAQWYVHPDFLNDEMKHYYSTAKYRVPGEVSAGKNNNRPRNFIPHD